MKYQNIKTGFVFESDSECKGKDWVRLNSSPVSEDAKEEKPTRAKRTKKDGNDK